MDFYSNFDNKYKEDVKQCLQIAGISDYQFAGAVDLYQQKLDGSFALYLSDDVLNNHHAIGLFRNAMNTLRKSLAVKYNEMGYVITEKKVKHMHLGMAEEELKKLTNDIKIIRFGRNEIPQVIELLTKLDIIEWDIVYPDTDTYVLVIPQLFFEEQCDKILVFQEKCQQLPVYPKEYI